MSASVSKVATPTRARFGPDPRRWRRETSETKGSTTFSKVRLEGLPVSLPKLMEEDESSRNIRSTASSHVGTRVVGTLVGVRVGSEIVGNREGPAVGGTDGNLVGVVDGDCVGL